MSNLLSVAEFRVIHSHTPQAHARLGRRYVLIMEASSTQNVYRLTHYRSGINRPVIMHPNWFSDYEVLLENTRHKITRRFQHGYSLIGWSADFPLLDWIHQRGYPLEPLPVFKNPALQLYLPPLSVG